MKPCYSGGRVIDPVVQRKSSDLSGEIFSACNVEGKKCDELDCRSKLLFGCYRKPPVKEKTCCHTIIRVMHRNRLKHSVKKNRMRITTLEIKTKSITFL